MPSSSAPTSWSACCRSPARRAASFSTPLLEKLTHDGPPGMPVLVDAGRGRLAGRSRHGRCATKWNIGRRQAWTYKRPSRARCGEPALGHGHCGDHAALSRGQRGGGAGARRIAADRSLRGRRAARQRRGSEGGVLSRHRPSRAAFGCHLRMRAERILRAGEQCAARRCGRTYRTAARRPRPSGGRWRGSWFRRRS